MTKKSGLRVLALAAGAAATMGMMAPMANASTVEYVPGTHVPATIAPQNCDSIPADRDLNVTNTIYDVATSRAVTPKVMLSMFEVAWVESHANNLPCGDSDSVGVFQQRPSQGWGTVEECMDIVHATNAYLDQAIPNDANNPDYTPGQLGQSVQRSAFPDRYDESEAKANEMIAEAQAT